MCYEKHKPPKYKRQVWAQPCYSSHTDEWNDLLILKESHWGTVAYNQSWWWRRWWLWDDDYDRYILTECCGVVVSTPASYKRRPGFKSQPGERLSRLRIFVVFSVPPGECRYSTLNLTTTSSFWNYLQFSTHYHFIRRYTVGATTSVVKQTTNK
jgi:hypothetical protein